MPDVSSCPQCHSKYRTSSVPAGKKLRCKKCKATFVVLPDDDVASAPTFQQPSANEQIENSAMPAAMGQQSSLSVAGLNGGVFLGADKPVIEALSAATGDEKYAVADEIARGGMGMILRAVDRDVRREVAMKVMLDDADERQRQRFVEEAQVTGQLEHPNIVPMHDLGIDAEGRLFFTMKLVKGRSLEAMLKAKKSEKPGQPEEYSLGKLLNVFVSICNAIAFAHAKGVLHRDLKPANVMLGDFGEVLVMDWGLAKIVVQASSLQIEAAGKMSAPQTGRQDACATSDQRLADRVRSFRNESGSSMTLDGTVVGTPVYMPPEQANGEISKLDFRSDVYSLGAILYEILTLKPPVEGKTIYMLLSNVVEGKVKPPEQRAPKRNIPRELAAIAMKALAREPEDRYQRVEDLRRDIELFIEGRAVSAKEDTFTESVVKLVKRNKGVSIAIGVATGLIMSVVTVGYWLNLQERRVAEHERAKSEKALSDLTAETSRRMELQKTAAPALLEKARREVEHKEFDGALSDLNTAVALDPQLAEARMLRAELWMVKGNHADALAELKVVLKRNPPDIDAQELAALCATAAQDKDDKRAPALAAIFMRRKEYALAETQLRSAEKLVALYNERLKRAWPKFSRRIVIEDGKVLLDLNTSGITDLIPFKGLPLQGLKLGHNQVTDLGPLEGMPLEDLNLYGNDVTDLTPLKGMRLRSLDLSANPRLKDLSPLHEMLLKSLSVSNSSVTDLSALMGMQLNSLNLNFCPHELRNLTPLKGMPLTSLFLDNVRVTDLTPLIGIPLTELSIDDCPVTDLTFLKDMKLEKFNFRPQHIKKGIEVIRAMKTLGLIGIEWNGKVVMPPEVFWKKYDAGEFK